MEIAFNIGTDINRFIENLKSQKRWLIEHTKLTEALCPVSDTEPSQAEGLINFLDLIQDTLVDEYGFPEDQVFDFEKTEFTGRFCYFIVESKTEPGKSIYPAIAKEGESGYYMTDYDYGVDKEIAQKAVDELNEGLGLSKEDCAKIIASTMRKQSK